MRNLKRMLCLALAAIMVLGLMITGAGAASVEDFSDVSEIQHKEAVEILSTLNVINGNDDGTYAPTRTITRAEMSKIICVLLNGGVDPKLGATVNSTYTDTANHWASGYIEYCTTSGIVAGKGDGTFGPDEEVTVAAAAKMMLVGLGYNATVQGYVGANWQLNVDVQANQKELYGDITVDNTSVPLTRDNAAQMAYNALDTKMVVYDYVITGTGDNAITTQPQLNEDKKGTLLEEKFDAVKVTGVVLANESSNLESSSSALEAGKTRISVDAGVSYYNEDPNNTNNSKDVTFSISSGLDELGRSVTLYVKRKTPSTDAQVLGQLLVSDDNKEIVDTSSDSIYTVADDNGLSLKYGTTQVANNFGGLSILTESDATKDQIAGVEKVLIDNDDDSEVDVVLLNTWNFGRVTTYVTDGNGSILVNAGNASFSKSNQKDVIGFENVAKDDYVMAAYIGGDLHVEAAQSVPGKLDTYKLNSAGDTVTEMSTGGTTYTVSAVTPLYTGGDDDILQASAKETATTTVGNDTVFFLDHNDCVVALGEADANASKYALVLAKENGLSESVRVALADGTEAVYSLNTTGVSAIKINDVQVGRVYPYTLNSSSKIKLSNAGLRTEHNGANASFSKGKIAITANFNTFSAEDGTTGKTSSAAPTLGSGTANKTYHVGRNTVFFYVNSPSSTTDLQDQKGLPTSTVASSVIANSDVDAYRNYESAPDTKSDDTYVSVYTKGKLDDADAGDEVAAVVFFGVDVARPSVSDTIYVQKIISTDSNQTKVLAFLNGSAEPKEITLDEEFSAVRTTGTYSLNTDGTYSLKTNVPGVEIVNANGAKMVKSVVGRNFVVTDNTGDTSYRITADTVIVNDSEYLNDPVATYGTNGTVSVNDVIIGLVVDGNDALMVVVRNPENTNGTIGTTDTSWINAIPAGATPVTDVNKIQSMLNAGLDPHWTGSYNADRQNYNDAVTAIVDLVIPAGRTLYITGDLTVGKDANLRELQVNGKLYVGGKLTVGSADSVLSPNANSYIQAGSIELPNSYDAGVTPIDAGKAWKGKVETVGDLKAASGNIEINLASGATMIVGGDLDLGTGGRLTAEGHAEVNGNVAGNAVDVLGPSTLVVGGTLKVTTVNIGEAGDNGRTGKLVFKNVPGKTAGFGSNVTVTVNKGTLELQTSVAGGENVEITMAPDTTLDAKAGVAINLGANGEVTLTNVKSATAVAITAPTVNVEGGSNTTNLGKITATTAVNFSGEASSIKPTEKPTGTVNDTTKDGVKAADGTYTYTTHTPAVTTARNTALYA